MAWTDQCKIAFQSSCDHLVYTQKGKRKNVTMVLKKLSQESGIPFTTLKRWYYEGEKDKREAKNCTNNGTVQEPPDNTTFSEGQNPRNPDRADIPNKTIPEIKEDIKKKAAAYAAEQRFLMCAKCGKHPVEIRKNTGEPARSGKFVGLCGSCRKKAKVINNAIALATKEDDGNWVICPNCRHSFLSPQKERA